MNTLLLEELLTREEGVNLEFKESIDLENKEGKAKFLKEMLALANSADDHAYLILGVEDESRKLVGIQKIGEERLQQIVADECNPPIRFSFSAAQYKGVLIGMIQIPHSHRKPHTIKKKLGYSDSDNGKQQEIRENQVFVRRGSITREASTDEIIEMAQSRGNDFEYGADLAYSLDRIDSSLQQIISSLDYRNDRYRFPNRWLEGAFVGTVVGMLTGWLAGNGWSNAAASAIFMGPIVALVLSVMRYIQYGILRTLFTGIFIGLSLSIIFSITPSWEAVREFFAGPELVMWIVYGAVAGTISGILGVFLLGYFERTWIHR